ncbi:hypothetical protein WMY93_019536 [Mugilogobius chulae]|uniref:C-type lectin domain-containing protein n=1 Tax=Mugilogobius chulae TaxID=88201 RepID=A0AAW0NHE1_9GOBI
MTWADAEQHCVSQGANLVSIHSPEENKFVSTLIQNYDHTQQQTWIGLTELHKETFWVWSDGCPVAFTMWNEGQPDNTHGDEHCGEMNWGGHQQWNDRPCKVESPSVCATRKPVC